MSGVFVDTAALLALLDRAQSEHERAASTWRSLLAASEVLHTTNYVLVETFALTQRRLGIAAVRTFQRDFVPLLEIDWVDPTVHEAAVAALLAADRRRLSLVDLVSFEVMQLRGLQRAFTFDEDFAAWGFETLPG